MLCVHRQGFVNAQGRGVVDLSSEVIAPSDLLTTKLAVEHAVFDLTCFSSFSYGQKNLVSCTYFFAGNPRYGHAVVLRDANFSKAAMQPLGKGGCRLKGG